MARPSNKEGLLNESQKSFDRLLELVESIPNGEKVIPGVNGEWSVKDVLAHLCAWHGLIETWYIEGMAGNKPEMPAPGYTWKTTPQLNEKIFQDHKNESLDLVFQNLRNSHLKVQGMIEKHSDEELFTKKRYPWTGSTSMGSYFVSATSSHYQWAI
ncbi:ClbS/DfsB family four-helix bundle protein [Chloroflexota bacterium]